MRQLAAALRRVVWCLRVVAVVSYSSPSVSFVPPSPRVLSLTLLDRCRAAVVQEVTSPATLDTAAAMAWAGDNISDKLMDSVRKMLRMGGIPMHQSLSSVSRSVVLFHAILQTRRREWREVCRL
jgi:hypothetical protein